MKDPFYCIVDIPEDAWERLLKQFDGFGTLWVSGWCSEGRCIFSEDKVTATKILIVSGGRGFSRDNK